MASKPQQARAVAALTDDAAVLADGRDAANQLLLLIRAIDRRNLWHEIAWEPERAASEAARDVARVRRALDMTARMIGDARTAIVNDDGR